MHSFQYTSYSVKFKVFSMQCRVYSEHSTMFVPPVLHTTRCQACAKILTHTVNSVQCVVCHVQCAVCSMQCVVYSVSYAVGRLRQLWSPLGLHLPAQSYTSQTPPLGFSFSIVNRWDNLRKEEEMMGVPREIPMSSPASPRKSPYF